MHRTTLLTFCSTVAVLFGTTTAHAQFSDVQATRDDAEGIAYVFSRGIVNGYPNGTFRPDGSINRAEFAKIASLFYWEGEKRYPDMCNSVHFDDVPRGTWFFHYVCSAKDQGIVEGYPGTRIYAPDQPITVAEAAKMITKAFKMPLGDDTEGEWYVPYVRTLADRHALPTSLSSLNQPITRGQVAEIFYRLETNNLEKPTLTFSQLTGEEDGEEDVCTASPEETEIGSIQNPVAEEYEGLPRLGALFTAKDCGEKRLTSLYGDLSASISDLRVVLKKAPSWELYNALYGTGFAPTDGDNTAKSKNWVLTGPATWEELLQLWPYAREIQFDDCTQCG